MRTFVVLSLLALVAADSRLEQQGNCLVDGGEAISDLMDSTMFVWASMARCGKHGEEIKCEIAISSAIESVNSMINVILRAVDKCGDLHTKHKKCGMAAGTLSKSIAGLAASSGGILQKCPGAFGGVNKPHALNWNHAAGAMCVVNLKGTAKSLFKAIKALMKINKACDGDSNRKCISNDLRVVAALSGVGEYLAGTIGQCTSANNKNAVCAQDIASLVKHTTKVAMASVDLSKHCHEHLDHVEVQVEVPAVVEVQVPRLYEEDAQADAESSSIISPNLLLGAFLPVTALVSFVGGRFYANRRTEDAREFMSDNE